MGFRGTHDHVLPNPIPLLASPLKGEEQSLPLSCAAQWFQQAGAHS